MQQHVSIGYQGYLDYDAYLLPSLQILHVQAISLRDIFFSTVQDALQWAEQLPVTEQYDGLEQIGQQVEHNYIRLGDAAEAFMSYFHNSMAWHGVLTPKVFGIRWEPRGQCEETSCPER